jgi:hypothetical protein
MVGSHGPAAGFVLPWSMVCTRWARSPEVVSAGFAGGGASNKLEFFEGCLWPATALSCNDSLA